MNDSYYDTSAPSLMRVDHVSRTYTDGSVTALCDVSLEIRRSEYVAIMGPSGSGKSTLLNLLGTLDRPTEGEIYFEDQPLSRLRDLDRFRSQKIGFVFQSFYYCKHFRRLKTCRFRFEGPLSAPARAKRAAELLESVGMSHRSRHLPMQLSVGEHSGLPSPGHRRTSRRFCWPTSRLAISIHIPAPTGPVQSIAPRPRDDADRHHPQPRSRGTGRTNRLDSRWPCRRATGRRGTFPRALAVRDTKRGLFRVNL